PVPLYPLATANVATSGLLTVQPTVPSSNDPFVTRFCPYVAVELATDRRWLATTVAVDHACWMSGSWWLGAAALPVSNATESAMLRVKRHNEATAGRCIQCSSGVSKLHPQQSR